MRLCKCYPAEISIYCSSNVLMLRCAHVILTHLFVIPGPFCVCVFFVCLCVSRAFLIVFFGGFFLHSHIDNTHAAVWSTFSLQENPDISRPTPSAGTGADRVSVSGWGLSRQGSYQILSPNQKSPEMSKRSRSAASSMEGDEIRFDH